MGSMSEETATRGRAVRIKPDPRPTRRWLIVDNMGRPVGTHCTARPETAIRAYLANEAPGQGFHISAAPPGWIEERWARWKALGFDVAAFDLVRAPPEETRDA